MFLLANDSGRSFLGWVVFFIEKNGMQFVMGTLTTLFISLTGTIVGFVLGLGVVLVKESSVDDKASMVKKIFMKIVFTTIL